MKRLFALTLAIAAAPLCAQAMTHEELAKNICIKFGEMAESIMTLRQDEIPISKVLEANGRGIDIKTASEEDKKAIEIGNAIIYAAYSEDAMLSEDNKERQRKRFRNDVEKRCFIPSPP